MATLATDMGPRAPAAPAVLKLPHGSLSSSARELAALMLDAVDDGASVGLMADADIADAATYWLALAREQRPDVVLAVRDAAGLAGVAVLQPATAAFQAHRAEIAKVIVHRRARRRGLASALLRAAEHEALALGRTVLTLRTRRGCEAERLYQAHGWSCAGVIPQDSLRPDGVRCDGAIYVKQLLR